MALDSSDFPGRVDEQRTAVAGALDNRGLAKVGDTRLTLAEIEEDDRKKRSLDAYLEAARRMGIILGGFARDNINLINSEISALNNIIKNIDNKDLKRELRDIRDEFKDQKRNFQEDERIARTSNDYETLRSRYQEAQSRAQQTQNTQNRWRDLYERYRQRQANTNPPPQPPPAVAAPTPQTPPPHPNNNAANHQAAAPPAHMHRAAPPPPNAAGGNTEAQEKAELKSKLVHLSNETDNAVITRVFTSLYHQYGERKVSTYLKELHKDTHEQKYVNMLSTFRSIINNLNNPNHAL